MRPAVPCFDSDANVVRPSLRVLDEDVEVAIVIENAGVEQFELAVGRRAPSVLLDQLAVWELGLRVLVEVTQIRMTRRRIEMKVILFDVFAVIAFGIIQTEKPFLEDAVAAVPERRCENQKLIAIADAGDRVFAPAIRFGDGLIMSEKVPRFAIGAVIFANG